MARKTHARRSRLGRSVVGAFGVAALLALGLVAAPPARAATEQMNFSLAGAIRVGARDVPLPLGSTWSATVDSATGAITNGRVSIPPTISVEQGVEVVTTISDATPSTGTLDLATGAIELTSSYMLNINWRLLGYNCDLGPIDATPSTDGGSALAGSPATATLVDEGFRVPVATPAVWCPDAIAAAVSDGLGAPTTDTSLSLRINQAVTDVYLVHGLDFEGESGSNSGSFVTVCAGAATIAGSSFHFQNVIGPVRMTSAQEVALKVYRGPEVVCASPGESELLVDQTVTPDGAAMALVFTSPPGDVLAPELVAFPLDVACHQPGQGSVTVANASRVEVVFVRIDGAPLGQVHYGGSLTEPLAGGTYKIDVLLASDGSSEIPLFPADISTGVATTLFVVDPGSSPDGTSSPAVVTYLNIDLAACALAPTSTAPPAAATVARPGFTG